ncbi:hypothetical protein K7I13_12465 [Brucepastera parasyntrophica]|uniref:hypothetical protein n=1 Tax=Brucepastera parasyntrophica TaxID=2880008 RepID=UPI00210DB110|nr:hypothetical protein [Brucepastera parasyntrophica]ULQ59295.1 hypothetical protein K7I13_12465 [Brucepastera parasyntrophica]
MQTMQFDTIVSAEELSGNIERMILSHNALTDNFSMFFTGNLGDIILFDGHVQDCNFYLVSYISNYRKHIEVKGRVEDFLSFRRVRYTVTWMTQFDSLLRILFFIGFAAIIIHFVYAFPWFILLPLAAGLCAAAFYLVLARDKKITTQAAGFLFRQLITGSCC